MLQYLLYSTSELRAPLSHLAGEVFSAVGCGRKAIYKGIKERIVKKRLLFAVCLAMSLFVVIAGVACAWLPEVPPGLTRMGTVQLGQTAILGKGDATTVLVQTQPTIGPFVRVSWWEDSLGDGATEWYFFDGQGGGGYVTSFLFVRCFPSSCEAGEVALYVVEGWTRKQ